MRKVLLGSNDILAFRADDTTRRALEILAPDARQRSEAIRLAILNAALAAEKRGKHAKRQSVGA